MAPFAKTREDGVTVSSDGCEGQTTRASAAAWGALKTNDAYDAEPTTACRNQELRSKRRHAEICGRKYR